MDCREYQEQISAAVDNRLGQHEMGVFAEHIGKCPDCRYEYEMESITKSVTRVKAKMMRAPGHLMQHVVDQIEGEVSSSWQRFQWWRRVLAAPMFRPAVAFAAACIAVILLLNPGSNPTEFSLASLPPSDVIRQSLTNYMALVRGEIKPQIESEQNELVQSYFIGKTTFPVLVPRIKECKLVGGVLNEYSGIALAHVVYKHESELVYMYEVCWETVMSGDKVNVHDHVKNELVREGRFAATQPDGYSVFLWTEGRTLCAAVARMSKEDLIACITQVEPPRGAGW